MALRAPFIISVLGPTGSGKSHNVTNLVAKLKTGEFPLIHRFDSKDHEHGEPFRFTRVYYIGQRVTNSTDTTHNSNIQKLLDAGHKPGIGASVDEIMAKHYMGQENKFGGMIAPVKPASLIPPYIREILAKSKAAKEQNPLVVIDDCSSYLDGMPAMASEEMRNIFNVESHHGGLSIIMIYQKYPKDRLGGMLISASHYIMFPIPPADYAGASTGVSVNDFRTVLHSTQGQSKVKLAEFQDLIAKRHPNFVLFNKRDLIADADIGKEKPDEHDESPNVHK